MILRSFMIGARSFRNVEHDLSTITFSEYNSDGFLGVQIRKDADGDAATTDLHSPYGFLGRPDDPDPTTGLGAQAFVLYDGDSQHHISSFDPRVITKLPKLTKGGSTQYGKTGAFASIDGTTGTWTAYVPYAFSGATPAKACLITVDVSSPGNESIVILHGSGSNVSITSQGVTIANSSGSAYVQLTSAGIVLNGNTQLNGGVVAGGTGALPLVTAPGLIAYLTALEAFIASKLVAGPPPMLAAAVAATFTTKMVSGV